MDPLTIDVNLIRGGDWYETINLFEDDGVTARDTTDYVMEMTIKSPNGDLHDTLTTAFTPPESQGDNGITHTPAQGQFNLKIASTTLAAYDFATAERRVIVTDDAGAKTVLIIGNVTVR